MILSKTDILESLKAKHIIIEPFIEEFLGPSSYDLHLARQLLFFSTLESFHDLRQGRYELKPGGFILGVTIEIIGVPSGLHEGRIDGTSSLGRAGIATHITASKLNPGHTLHLTMEIKNQSTESVFLYEGMPIGQITFEELKTRVDTSTSMRSYGNLKSKTLFEKNPKPQKSKLIEKTESARNILKQKGFL